MATITHKDKIDQVIDNHYFEFFNDYPNAVYIASVPVNIKRPDLNNFYFEMGVWNKSKKKTEIKILNISEYLKKSNYRKVLSTIESIVDSATYNKIINEDIELNIKTKNVEPFQLQAERITHNTIRPASGGCAIRYEESNSIGTLGAIVSLDDGSDDWYILSNYHVMSPLRFEPGKLIFQPTEISRQRTTDYSKVIGRLMFGKFDEGADIALAIVLNKDKVKGGTIWDDNPILEPKPPIIGEKVKLHGATSYKKHGTIRSDNAYVKLKYRNRYNYFHKQILTTKMSCSGDSGSILINAQNNGVGMLIGGDCSKYSVFNNLNSIFNYGVELNPNNVKIKIKKFINPKEY